MKSDRTAKTDESKALDRRFFQTIYQTHQRHAKCVTKTKAKESKPSIYQTHQRHAKCVTPLILLTIPTSVQLTVHCL
jgi:hypothetical protein